MIKLNNQAYSVERIAYRKELNAIRYPLNARIFLIVIFCFLNLIGCAGVREVCKGLAGVSTKVLEDGRKDALKKEFNYDLITCHSKIRKILNETGSYIYTDDLDKDMLAVYISEEDTTPVGLFLTEKGKDTTLVEVASPSIYGKEKIAQTVFQALITGIINPEEKGKINAGKLKI